MRREHRELILQTSGGALCLAAAAGLLGWIGAGVWEYSEEQLEQRAGAYYECARHHPDALPDEIRQCAEQLLDTDWIEYDL